MIFAVLLCFGTVSTDAEAASYTAAYITKQPQNYYGEYGDNVTFSVEAYVTPGYQLNYQWYYRTSPSGTWTKAEGAVKSTLTVPFYRGFDNWQMACLISDGRVLLVSNQASIYHTSGSAAAESGSAEADSSSLPVVDPGAGNGSSAETADPEILDSGVEKVDLAPEEEAAKEPEVQQPANESANTAVPEVTTPEVKTPEVKTPETTTPAVKTPETKTAAVDSNSVTPEQYGAKGDGRTDDSAAIQKAVDSGKNVVFSSNKTYYIASDKYISITGKSNFKMSGGKIHKAASGSNYNLFVLRNCNNCTFENMYIYSEHTCKDILIPAGHTRPVKKSSNVLAFSGVHNSNINFINNSFANMSADYWFNGNASGTWANIKVNGWKSSTTLMPMYAQYITGLSVTNAEVSMHASYAGDGDHCIYICTKSDGVTIADSKFSWNGKKSVSGTTATLTFHGGSASAGTQPKNIQINNCTVNAGEGKTIYTGEGVNVQINNSTLSYSNSSSAAGFGVCTGYGSYTVKNSHISGYDTLVDVTGSFTAENTDFTGANANNGIFGTAPVVTCTGCTFNIGSGVLYYVRSGSGVKHIYSGCTITKNKAGSNSYLISKRSTAGSIRFDGCKINCGGGKLMYNGGKVPMSNVVLNNTTITNASALAASAELKSYSASNSTLNGRRI